MARMRLEARLFSVTYWSTTIVVRATFDSGQLASLRSLTEVFGPMGKPSESSTSPTTTCLQSGRLSREYSTLHALPSTRSSAKQLNRIDTGMYWQIPFGSRSKKNLAGIP